VWYTIFSTGAIAIGLSARILLPELTGGDVELALPILAQALLPSIFVGGILAGIFSATISTADSQVITCSASITQDLFPRLKNSYFAAKAFTILTMVLATGIALFGSQSVFLLVILAWSSCAVVLGVPVLIKLFGKTQSVRSLSIMMGVGFLVVVLWVTVLNASAHINEVLPAAVAMGCVYLVLRWRRRRG
jgi:sodium/proline symporter